VADHHRHVLVDQRLRGLHADARVGLIVLHDEVEMRGLAGDLHLLRDRIVERELHAVL
jgi:hypothetical protein